MKPRVIARLDIKGPNIVKGIHMEGLRVVGTPAKLAAKYYQQGVDELIAMDIVASLYGRSPDFDLMRSIANELFIPLTMGGGIQSLHDINNFLRAGADKVAINTFAIRNPALLSEAVRHFGSQCIVLSVEAKQTASGVWEAYTDGGREHSGRDVIEWIHEALDLGIGEILLTSVDLDGTGKGYDIELLQAVTAFSTVPVIIHGGAKDADSLVEAIRDGHADATSIASILHYDAWTIPQLKKSLSSQHIPIRIT